MLNRLGKKRYVFPFIIILVLGTVMGTMFYPISNMSVKDLPFAIVSEDSGVDTSEGHVNVGDAVVNLMTSSTAQTDGDSSPIKWKQLDSRADAEKAMKENKYYGYIIIPEDYSSQQLAAIEETMTETILTMKQNMASQMPSGGISMNGDAQKSAADTQKQLQQQLQPLVKSVVEANVKSQLNAKALMEQQKKVQSLTVQSVEAATAYKNAEKAVEEYIADQKSKDPTYDPEKDNGEEYAALVSNLDKTKEAAENLSQQLSMAGKALETMAQSMGISMQEGTKISSEAVVSAASVTASLMAKQFQGTMSEIVNTISSAMSAMKNTDTSQIEEMVEDKAGEAMVTAVDTINEKASSTGDPEEEVTGPSLEVYIDTAKSPMISMTMKSSLELMMAKSGMNADIQTINEGYTKQEEGTAVNPMGTVMGQNVVIMPMVMLSLILGLIITRIINMTAVRGMRNRIIVLLKQLGFAVVISACIAGAIFALMRIVGGIEVPFGAAFPYLWMASLFMMMISLGLGDIQFGLAAVFIVCTIALGMSLGILPIEVLPDFWQQWISPWAPQRFMGEGLRSVIYMYDGAWNVGTCGLSWYALAGAVLAIIGVLIPRKCDNTPVEESASESLPETEAEN